MASQHDPIGIRLSQMLRYFLSGERMSAKEFAKEFGVSLRTIQRDLSERLGFLPLQKDIEGKLYLPKESLNKVGFQDIRKFASLSGIYGLYPSLEDSFLEALLYPQSLEIRSISNQKSKGLFVNPPNTTNIAPPPPIFSQKSINSNTFDSHSRPIIIKNYGFEEISKEIFTLLHQAILESRNLKFIYKNKNRNVSPYALLNNSGIWYLLADEGSVLKHFSLRHIVNLTLQSTHFIVDSKIQELIDKSNTTWINQLTKEATLKIDKKAKVYFLRKKFINNIRIQAEDSQSFYVLCQYSYDDEILNLAKMFLPFIRILEPKELQQRLEEELRVYLNEDST